MPESKGGVSGIDMKGKVFPFAPIGSSPPLNLLPYGTQGTVANASLTHSRLLSTLCQARENPYLCFLVPGTNITQLESKIDKNMFIVFTIDI